MLPKNQPVHFIVEIPVDKSLVELIVTTRNPDVAIKAYDKKVISKLQRDIEIAIESFNAEKIQYLLNEENNWELNYLLTKDGKVIGQKNHLREEMISFKK